MSEIRKSRFQSIREMRSQISGCGKKLGNKELFRSLGRQGLERDHLDFESRVGMSHSTFTCLIYTLVRGSSLFFLLWEYNAKVSIRKAGMRENREVENRIEGRGDEKVEHEKLKY